jgi:hypothetical protein
LFNRSLIFAGRVGSGRGGGAVWSREEFEGKDCGSGAVWSLELLEFRVVVLRGEGAVLVFLASISLKGYSV